MSYARCKCSDQRCLSSMCLHRKKKYMKKNPCGIKKNLLCVNQPWLGGGGGGVIDHFSVY